jgi:broad specificity phosphatase PhoE
MTRFCLIRHGQTDWNVEGRYQGQADAPLNEVGRAQALALGKKILDQSFAAIYSSDLSRASETAQIIASFLHLPVSLDPRLREINQGEWEGKHISEIRTRYAQMWKKHRNDPDNARPPGGETITEVAQRMFSALNELSDVYPEGLVLVVSHGLSLATVICRSQGLPVERAYEIIPANTEPIWITWENKVT